MKQLTVSIGIPAYNEEVNILPLLQVLLKQKLEHAVLTKILVVSDASSDQTVKLARETGSSLVEVIDGKERLGQQKRQNEILEKLDTDIIVIIEADTCPVNEYSLNQLVKPFMEGTEPGMVTGQTVTIKPETFFEKILYYGVKFKEEMFTNLRQGDNIYCSGGHDARAFSKKFAQILRWPDDVPEDSYAYLALKRADLRMVKSWDAKFYAKNVDNVPDRHKQVTKYVSGKKSLEKYFSAAEVEKEYAIPLSFGIKHLLLFLIKHPFWTLMFVGEMIVNRVRTFGASAYNPFYEPYTSSKNLKISPIPILQSIKPTVTIAVSALNEEDNILPFLNSVIAQKEDGYILEKILVISDGSTDRTVEMANSINHPKLEVKVFNERTGKSKRLNDLYESLISDVLIQTDADVVFSHELLVRDLVQALMSDKAIGMCGGHPLPLPGQTSTEKAVNCTVMAYDEFRATLRGGNNVFSADGRILAYRKELVKKIKIPSDMIANDMFTYFSCLSLGYKYRYVATAVVHFRSPKTLADQVRQNTRFVAAPARMKQYFGEELVSRERNIPFTAFAKSTLKQFLRHPILCTYIILVNAYCRMKARKVGRSLSAKWDIAFSTKHLDVK
jgi:poly-beta-1,6-N-acetyl-D-glucosamine synthase